jgi:asparagine synthase (glutamine-hydrolysing)
MDSTLARDIDLTAIAQFVSFEYVLGERTLLTNVQLLPPASVLTLVHGKVILNSYWRLGFEKVYTLKSEEDYLDGLMYYMRQAVTRQRPGKLAGGINLSGGLDSRVLLGLLVETQDRDSLRAFTFGIPGCDDARFARELAKAAGVRHHFYELKPDYLLDVADEAVLLTDGMESCVHVHALANLPDQAEYVEVLYTGYLMDSLMSPDVTQDWIAKYDDDTVRRILFADLNKDYLFVYAEQKSLFTSGVYNQVKDELDGSFQKVLDGAKADSIVDWQNNLELVQRQRRFTANGNELMRSRVVTRTPFCDNDLVEFALTIPPGLRFNRYLYLKAITRMFNGLSKIPWEKTGYPLVACTRDLMLRFDNQMRWRLRGLGLNWIPVAQNRPYADYDHWLRTDLRPWMEKLLLDDRFLGRGYFNPDYIRNLVADHLSGRDHASRLGILFSLELWHRKFVDERPD